MIAQLTGKLAAKQATTMVVDVNGVGYEVSVPLTTASEFSEIGGEVTLKIYTHVREDALQLYGFKTARDKSVFLMLISVSGIGTKSAIVMLSTMSASEIINAIRQNNLARLISIPGIGRKTAERLVIELRDKVNQISSEGVDDSNDVDVKSSSDSVYDDTLEALLTFGYGKPIAERALKTATHDGGEQNVEALLRRCLRILSK